jgi:hypothetical protein
MEENEISKTPGGTKSNAFLLIHTLPKVFSPRKCSKLKFKIKRKISKSISTSSKLPVGLCRYQLPTWQNILTNQIEGHTVLAMDYFHPLPHDRTCLSISYRYDACHRYRFEVVECQSVYAFDFQSETPWDFDLKSKPFREHSAEGLGVQLPTESDGKPFTLKLHGCRTIEVEDHLGKFYTFSPFRHSNDSSSHSIGITDSETDLWKVIVLGGFFPEYRNPEDLSEPAFKPAMNGLLTQVTEAYFNLFRDILKAYRSYGSPQVALEYIDTRFIMLSLQTVSIIYTKFWSTALEEWKIEATAFKEDKRYSRHKAKVKQIIKKFSMTVHIAEELSKLYLHVETLNSPGCTCPGPPVKNPTVNPHPDLKCPIRQSLALILTTLDQLEQTYAGEWQDPSNFLVENYILSPAAGNKDIWARWLAAYNSLAIGRLAEVAAQAYGRGAGLCDFWRPMKPSDIRDFIAESFSRVLIGHGRVALMGSDRGFKMTEFGEAARVEVRLGGGVVSLTQDKLVWAEDGGMREGVELDRLNEMPRVHVGKAFMLLYTQPEKVEQFLEQNPLPEGQEQTDEKAKSKLWCFDFDKIGKTSLDHAYLELLNSTNVIINASTLGRRIYAIEDEYHVIEKCKLTIWDINGDKNERFLVIKLTELLTDIYPEKAIIDEVNQQITAANDYLITIRPHKKWFLIWSTELDSKSKIQIKATAIFMSQTGKVENYWSMSFLDRVQSRDSWNLPYRIKTFEHRNCNFVMETQLKGFSFQLWSFTKAKSFAQLYNQESSISIFKGIDTSRQISFLTAAIDPHNSDVCFMYSYVSPTHRGPSTQIDRVTCKLWCF